MNASVNEYELQFMINKKYLNINKPENKKIKPENKKIKPIKKFLPTLEVSVLDKKINVKKPLKKNMKKKKSSPPVEEHQQLPNLSLDEIETSACLLTGDLFTEVQIKDMDDWDVEEYFTKVSGDQFAYSQLTPTFEDGDWEPEYLDTTQQKEELSDFEIEKFMDVISEDQFKESQIDLFEDFQPISKEVEVIFWDSDDD